MAYLSSATVTAFASHLITTAKYAGLFSTAPTPTDLDGTEYIGGHTRQPLTLTRSSGSVVNDAALSWYRLSPGVITGVGLFTAISGGELIAYVPVAAPSSVRSDQSWTIMAGALVIRLQ